MPKKDTMLKCFLPLPKGKATLDNIDFKSIFTTETAAASHGRLMFRNGHKVIPVYLNKEDIS